jgi:hypothetical protein
MRIASSTLTTTQMMGNKITIGVYDEIAIKPSGMKIGESDVVPKAETPIVCARRSEALTEASFWGCFSGLLGYFV